MGVVGKFPGDFWLGPGTNYAYAHMHMHRSKMDILKRQIKNFTVGLKEYNPDIMLNPISCMYSHRTTNNSSLVSCCHGIFHTSAGMALQFSLS